MIEPEPVRTVTWRDVQDQWDKGVLPEGRAHDYLGDLLSLIALRAPELLSESTPDYSGAGDGEGLPPTETADL